MSRFRPPRDPPDLGLQPGAQARFNAWLRTAFVEIAEDLAAATATDAPTVVHQERVDVPAGAQRRVSPPRGGMAAILPCPSPANAGLVSRIMIENPVGSLTVVASPGTGADGKVFAPTINGAAQATYSLPGLVAFHSNGINDWKTVAEVPAETATSSSSTALLASLDATYHLQTANSSLPKGRVGAASSSIAPDYSAPGRVTWAPVDGFFTWAYVLEQGNNSGAFNPNVDSGQFLGFGAEGSLPGSGQIRADGAFTLNGDAAVTVQGVGQALIRSTTGNVGLFADAANVSIAAVAGSVLVTAGGVERLEFEPDGAWQVAGDPGTLGELIVNQGASSTPLWGQAITASYTDGSVTADKLASDVTLAEVLSRGDETLANDIHVSTGQQLVFDVGGDGLGDIQSLGVLNVRTASTFDLRAATGNVGITATAGNFNMSGTSQLNFTASAATGFIRFIVNGAARFWMTGTGAFAIGAGADRGILGELFMSQGDTTPIWGQAVTASYTDGSVTPPKLATQAARTVLSNNTLATASPTAVSHADLIIKPDLLDCFVGGAASTTLPNSALGWNFRNVAGTGTCTRQNGSTEDGVYRIGTGAAGNDNVVFTLGDTNTRAIMDPRYFKYTEFIIQLSAVTSTRLQIGYMQDAGVDSAGTDALMFIYDTTVAGSWTVRSRSASVSTSTLLGTAVTTSRVRLGIATTFFPAEARFYINGTLVATHATNVPLVQTNVGIRLQTFTNAARTLDFSRFTAIRYTGDRLIPEA